MSQEQKKIVVYWLSLITVCLIGTCISLTAVEYKKVALFIVIILFAGVSLIQDFSFYARAGARHGGLGRFIENHPRLKIYLVLYCALIMPFMVYTLSNMAFSEEKILLYFFNIVMLLGPVLLVSERERFKSYAINKPLINAA